MFFVYGSFVNLEFSYFYSSKHELIVAYAKWFIAFDAYVFQHNFFY